MTEATRPDVATELAALRRDVETCARCPLHKARTQAVFGEGDPGAGLMFVGEAPGYHEDRQGRPFVGAAGKLLDELLASIGLRREQVYIANVLKSRPPGNRDPQPDEIAACRPYLEAQIALIRPVVICSLGNFATKLLSGNQSGITKVHGVPQVKELGGHRFHLYPIFHPAAALYTPSTLGTLRADMYRLPQLLTEPPPRGVSVSDSAPAPVEERDAAGAPMQPPPPASTVPRTSDAVMSEAAGREVPAAGGPLLADEEQLGLF